MNKQNSKRIKQRCAVIAELVQQMQPMYLAKTTNEYQCHHIETIVGAGIWYIPNSSLWTGKASLEVIKSFHPKFDNDVPKFTKDHQYPRKVAARKLLNIDWFKFDDPVEEITKMYLEEFGIYNLVTPKENRDLMKYQRVKVFLSPQDAYDQAGIHLISLTDNQLQEVRRRNKELIESLLHKA